MKQRMESTQREKLMRGRADWKVKHEVRVEAGYLESFVRELFEKAGMERGDAQFHAEALVQTDLWGISSHDCMRVPAYFERMRNGAINVRPNVRKVSGEGAFEVLDADAGAGFIAGKRAMERAMELAKKYHIAAVGVRNSNHFGAGAVYARMAAKEGMAGIAMTNVLPLVTAPGASRPVTGNNPIAVAIPTYGDFPFCLDMALSKVAGGKLTLAIKRGEKIPMDWATDEEGRPTDDPEKAFKGFLLPVGGYKGLGLAYVVDILSGVVTGGVFSHQMKSMYAQPTEPSLTGHFFVAVDIDAVIDREQMKQRMGEYFRRIKETPMWEEGAEMLLPGELEYRKEKERRENGIPVPVKTYEELLELKKTWGLQAELPEKQN